MSVFSVQKLLNFESAVELRNWTLFRNFRKVYISSKLLLVVGCSLLKVFPEVSLAAHYQNLH